MGGGGSYYDRDVTDRSLRTSRGTSTTSEEKLKRSKADPASSPFQRRIACTKKNPCVGALDGTGSMDVLPKIVWDKWPNVVGELAERGYLEEPELSLSVVGDVVGDEAPIQIGDFTSLRKMDNWLERLWLEGNGGGQAVESYEFTAYFYARMCDMPNAEVPIFIFTGDEGFREKISANEQREYFGPGEYQDVTAKEIFAELLKKFKGNVFLIHRQYRSGNDERIVRQWQGVLGKERVLFLKSDVAVADVWLGIVAIMSGSRTLDEYCQDMRTRVNKNTGKSDPQPEGRIAEVRETLQPILAIAPAKKKAASKSAAATTVKSPSSTSKAKAAKKQPGPKPAGKKPGRL